MALAARNLAVSTATSAAEGRFQRTLPVTGPVDLDIHTHAGDIDVRAGVNPTIEIRGTIRPLGGSLSSDDAEKKVSYLESHPPIEQKGNTIKIGAFVESHMQLNISINYELVVPVNTRLASSSGSGSQAVDGISGPLDVSAGSGDIKARNIGGCVEASAGSGHIVLQAVKGAVRVSTGCGDIRATGVEGGVCASTGSGNVTIEEAGAGEARVNTGLGSIALKDVRCPVHARTTRGSIIAEGGGQSPWYLESVSGNVYVRVPPKLGFNLRAHTASGTISTNRPITILGTISRKEITGKAGTGGFLLDVSTVSGNIDIDWTA